MTTVPQGQVRIYQRGNPDVFVQAWLDDEAPEFGGGVGGWTEVARARRTALIEWQGTPLFSQRLPLLIDSHATGGSVEGALNRLRVWGRPVGKSEPPVLKFEGPGLEGFDLEWVLNGMTWGDGILNDEGVKSRQAVSLDLLQYVPSMFLLPSASTATKFRTIKARKGDTLVKIAKRVLGDGKKWRVLKALNKGVRDPNRVLRTGVNIRVPR